MKINDKEFLNPQQQLYQNTKDIEELKEKYKNEIYAVKPFSEWPEDAVLPEVEDPRDFTYVPRSITNVPADAKYGYLLINVENSFEPADSAALFYKIKSVNNSTVYIEFYANVASHVPGPQGPAGADSTVPGPQGPQGNSIFSCDTNLDPTPDELTAVSTALIHKGSSTLKVGDIIVGVDGIFGYLSSVGQITSFVTTVGSLKGPQGTATIGIQVVATLPSTGTEGVIYLVPAEDPETGNAYDEYIYTNNAWEKFGYLNIDLTNYALKSELPVIDEDLIPKAFNTYVLGDNTHSYKEVVANKFKSPNSYYEISGANISGHGQMTVKTTDGNGTNEALLQLDRISLSTNKNIVPTTTGINLGNASSHFNNLYLDGKIVTDDNLTYGFILPDTTNYTADKTLATTDQIPVINENIIPKTAYIYDLGSSTKPYKDLYLGGSIKSTYFSITTGGVNDHGTAILKTTDAQGNTEATLRLDYNKIQANQNLVPSTNNTLDLGTNVLKYKDLYLAGNLTDGTNSVAIADIATTDQLFSGSYTDLTNKPTLGTAASADTGTSAGNVPILDANGKLSDSILPALAISDTFVVNSQASMLALTAQVGDVCVRTDLNKSYILKTAGASTLANWQELLTPTDAVQSVNGHTGAVTLTQADLNIIYSSTQPSNPVNGTIWIKPTN